MGAKRTRLVIHGRVQGVAFRYYAERKASSLGVVGWVRNRRDGTVELIAEGEESVLSDLVAWCHEGPPSARVDAVDVNWLEPTGEFSRFVTARTA